MARPTPAPWREAEETLHRCHEELTAERGGDVSRVYPSLSRADPERFGLALAGIDGAGVAAGDADLPFTMMSVAKPFVFALACATHGLARVRDLVGVDATGLPFNSATAVERAPGGRTNPMVNAGALATTSLTPGSDIEERWNHLRRGLSQFAGRDLEVDQETLECATRTNTQNRALALLLRTAGGIVGDPMDAVELYTRQSCLRVSSRDLARMGACLADGGLDPWTGARLIDAEVARATLAVMVTAGMYESSGSWLMDVGLPGKSGIGGGIIAVSPRIGALAAYSAPLDAHGNSVRGVLAARRISTVLGLSILECSGPHPAIDE